MRYVPPIYENTEASNDLSRTEASNDLSREDKVVCMRAAGDIVEELSTTGERKRRDRC